MITGNAGGFVIDWARYADAWVVYSHTTQSDPLNPDTATLIYIGCCRFRDLGTWPDAQANSEWGKALLAWETNRLTVHVTAICDNEAEARNERMRQVAALPHRPICNAKGFQQRGNGLSVPILCNETGMEYQSAAEASRLLGVTPAMMSAHLNGKLGFNTVKGLTFRRKDAA